MRRIPVRFWGLALFIVVLNCGAIWWIRREVLALLQPELRPATVVATLPNRDVDEAERLSIIFDRPVVDPAKVGKVDDAPPFQISPKVSGQWLWATPEQLDFVLNDPLPPGQRFEVDPHADIEIKLGQPVEIAKKIEFNTRGLKLDACQLISADRDSIQCELRFNQRVAPEELLKNLKIQVPQAVAAAPRSGIRTDVPVSEFQVVTPKCLTDKPDSRLVLRFDRPRSSEFQVVLAAELKGFQASKELGRITSQTIQLPHKLAFLRTEIDHPDLDVSVPVKLLFSESLSSSQSLPPISVVPPVKGFSTQLSTGDYGRNMLVLYGEFQPGNAYTANVGKTLLAENGQTLVDDIKVPFTIPEREPMVKLAPSHGVLTPQGNLMLDLETVNVGQLRIRAQRIHANNLVAFLHEGSSYHQDELSRTIVEKSLAIPGAGSTPRKHALDLRKLTEQERPLGTYLLEVRATDQSWRRDHATVVITDLGMIVKRDLDSVWVWVSSLKTAQPIAGVQVSALSSSNQTLVKGTTNAEGIVRLPVDSRHPDGLPWVIVAENDRDMVYQLLGTHEWLQDHIDRSGRPQPGSYEVLLYPDRGVYRPGDTLHVTGLIRDQVGAIPPSFPLAIKVTRPDGRIATTLNVTPAADRQGTFHFDFPTQEDFQTGRYVFSASLPGAPESFGSVDALVEAFVPARIEVLTDASHEKYQAKEAGKLTVSGRYLFGQPAAELPLSITGTFQFQPYVSEFAPGFSFSSLDKMERQIIEVKELKLDSQGKCEVRIDAPPETPRGVWKAVLTATVSEPGGRSISKNSVLSWDTAERHLGLKVADYVTPNQDVPVEFVQVTRADQPAPPGAVKVTLSRVEFDSVARQSHGTTQWVSVRRETTFYEQIVSAEAIQQGIGRLTVKCPSSGVYRLLVTDVLSGQTAASDIYAYGRFDEQESVSLEKPERLEIVLDQPRYKPGSTAKVTVKSPFAGTLVLSVETNKVLEHRVVAMKTNATTIEIPVSMTLRGGAFIAAAVVRPLDATEKSWLPHRAMGLARLVTDHSEQELAVQIESPTQIRPMEPLKVSVKSRPSEPGKPTPFVHLWAVDEGILLTTAFETPRPFQYFLGQRTLGVATQDIYVSLLPDHMRPADWSRIGGDGDGNETGASRRSLVPPKKIESVVLWHGFAPVNEAGMAEFDFALPNFNGELRLMATAVDGDRYGSTQKAVTISSPLMLEVNWPRFSAPGDEFRVPVKLFNSTSEQLSVALSIKVDGPLTVTLPPETAEITVKPQTPVTVWLPVRATGMGSGNVSIVAKASTSGPQQLISITNANLPVRPGLPLHSVSVARKGAAGTPVAVKIPDEFETGTATTRLKISPQPNVEFLPAVDSLLDYPYGCVEQTTSRLWALLVAREILGTHGDMLGRQDALDQMLSAGVNRLWSMQTARGGLSYWPGDQNDHPWGTVYAAEFIAEAIQRGIPVDSQFRNELIEFLSGMLHERNGMTSSPHLKAQICHVLAKFQRPEEGWMSRLSEQRHLLDMESRAELAQAWNATGRKDRARQLLTNDTLEQLTAAEFNVRITSPNQQMARLLIALLEIDVDHPWVPGLATKLLNSRRDGRWNNTAENAQALRALLKYQGGRTEPADYSGSIAGPDIKSPLIFTSKEAATFSKLAGVSDFEIQTAGKGPFFVMSTTTGIMRGGISKSYDRQIQVRRTWSDRFGKPVQMDNICVGDLITVEVTLKNSLERAFEPIANIAIVDALPGGFEIENPRLATSADRSHQEGEERRSSVAEHVEFLDDRVILFAKSRNELQTFRYDVRAVTVGRFAAPAIQASCMYDEEVASLHGGGQVEVKQERK